MSEAFDHIPFEDLVQPFSLLGSGSFGSVYRSTYLGLPVALKQITPSKDYDVNKYFEREWRLMREARHPNVVLYLGLSTSPDSVVYIVSEFIEGGNLRSYIHDKRKPFPWTMRISFATDIVRALAYLHARKCIHRDLKPENLLLTSNGRVKITDFGFARIAPRSTDEQKRLTFCGTDSYMSPEILIGDSFDLPTDVFSLGIILCEIMSRTLADDHHFKRSAPYWSVDEDEIRKSANQHCPAGLADLAIECTRKDASERPAVVDILKKMRDIELEVFQREGDAEVHVGSVKFATGGRRPKMAPRIPSFGVLQNGDTLKVDTSAPAKEVANDDDDAETTSSDDDDELEAALRDLEMNGGIPSASDDGSAYSTTVIKAHGKHDSSTPSNMSSILTIRGSPSETEPPQSVIRAPIIDVTSRMSVDTVDSFQTATSSMSIAVATIGGDEPHSTLKSLRSFSNGSPLDAPLLYHRFTMIKPGTKSVVSPNKRHSLQSNAGEANGRIVKNKSSGTPRSESFGWSPFGFFRFGGSKSKGSTPPAVLGFHSAGGNTAKCDLCNKRLGLGFKTVLECDDCGLRAHVKCGEYAPKDCGMHAFGSAVEQNSGTDLPRTRNAIAKTP